MYDPSPKQRDAIANMQRQLGLHGESPVFPDPEGCSTYISELIARCQRQGQARQRSSLAEVRERHQQRVENYYRDSDHLLAYARKYALRYQPSWAKLCQQLRKKCPDESTCEAVEGQLREGYDEQTQALAMAERLQHQGRSGPQIAARLRQARFAKDSIEQAIHAISAEDGSTLNSDAIERRISQWRRRGLSNQAIRQRLGGTAGDRALVDQALHSEDGDEDQSANSEDQALVTMISRLRRQNLDERTLIRRLQSRGFRYAQIRRSLDASRELEE